MFKMNSMGLMRISPALICILPALAFADFCPDVSALQKVGNIIVGYDTAGRKLTYDDSSGLIQFIPSQIGFKFTKITVQLPSASTQLSCGYYNNQQGLNFNMIDSNNNDQVMPASHNWQKIGFTELCVSGIPELCNYIKPNRN